MFYPALSQHENYLNLYEQRSVWTHHCRFPRNTSEYFI